jgi:hypothetical protein
MSVEDVARKLKRPADEVRAWEAEGAADAPTYVQLESLAYEVLKRPLAVFFLPAPPQEVPPKKEFRTLPDADLQALHADTHLQVRKAHAYQIALRELYDHGNPGNLGRLQQARLSLRGSVAHQAQVLA